MTSLIQLAQQITRLGQFGLTIGLVPSELLANMFGYRCAGRHGLLLRKVLQILEKLHTEELTADAQCFHHCANPAAARIACLAQKLCIMFRNLFRFNSRWSGGVKSFHALRSWKPEAD